MLVTLFSEGEWKTHQTAVLCALQTYDNYQKEHNLKGGSVKYMVPRSLSGNLDEPVTSNYHAKTTTEVMHTM